MGCNCAKNKPGKHQVKLASGKVLTFLTEVEARTAAARMGGSYQFTT